MRLITIVVVALFVLPASYLAPTSAQPATVTNWAWAAPTEATGDAVFRVSFDAGERNECEASAEATGSATRGPRFRFSFNQTSVTYSNGPLVHVHDDAYGIDTRGSGTSSYDVGATIGGTRSGLHHVTLALRGMLGQDGEAPATFGIFCDEPFVVVGFSGSREVVAWRHDAMDGGRGASAQLIVAEAGLNLDDAATATFASTRVEVDLYESPFNAVGHYDWRLDAPGGSHGDAGLIEGGRFQLEDGAGEYRFDLTRVAAGESSDLMLWMLGFAPVVALEEVLA